MSRWTPQGAGLRVEDIGTEAARAVITCAWCACGPFTASQLLAHARDAHPALYAQATKALAGITDKEVTT